MSDRRIPFTPEDEDRIAGASVWGIIAALTSMISALVNAGALFLMPKLAVPALVIHGIVLVISPLLGIWLIQACVSFRAVARTDVADKAYLLRGFERLHHYFMTIGILLIVGIVAAVVLLVLRLVRGGLSFH